MESSVFRFCWPLRFWAVRYRCALTTSTRLCIPRLQPRLAYLHHPSLGALRLSLQTRSPLIRNLAKRQSLIT